jgi:hypothetical protein
MIAPMANFPAPRLKLKPGYSNWEYSIKYPDFKRLTLSIIYIWWRGRDCRYIGQSRYGLVRPLNSSHDANIVEEFKPGDELQIIQCPKEQLNQLERELIQKYLPELNRTGFSPKTNIDAIIDNIIKEKDIIKEKE